MIFFSVIIALALVQWWGSGAPLQHDGWFYVWVEKVRQARFLGSVALLRLLVTLALPCIGLAAVCWAVAAWLSPLWLVPVAVVVLLYSLGRGDFSASVKAYMVACSREDSVAASYMLEEVRGPVSEGVSRSQGRSRPEAEGWTQLNQEVLAAIAYRGFERMFAVLFWFFLLGPVGAFLYRLSLLYREKAEGAASERWVWFLEWPAARIMGLTWAMAGNFDTCFPRVKRSLTDRVSAAPGLTYNFLTGALGQNGGASDAGNEETVNKEPEESRRMIQAALPLLSRSLLLWVCILALVVLLI